MHTLDKAVDTLLQSRPNWQKDRDNAVANLKAIIANCQQAISIWQDYLKLPTTPEGDDNKMSLVKWIGHERALKLHQINIDVIQAQRAIAVSAEPYYLGAGINLEPHVIEEAYRQIGKEETGSDVAKASIAEMERRVKWLQGLADKLTKASAPKKAAGAKAAKKKQPKKKPATKKKPTKKKAVKKTTKKKPAKKKAKKPVKKKSVKKKASKKKAVKKKAKKAAKKKVAKKKAKKQAKKRRR